MTKHIIAGERMAALLDKHRHQITRPGELGILAAADGEELLALHREHQARLLILDVQMPGPTPEEICRRVRADAALRKVSLIVIGNPLSLPLLKRCAANRSFLRPLNQEDFLGAVRSLINVAARKDYRVLIGVQLKGIVRNTPFFGRSENISATGMLFTTNRIFDLGETPELSFMLPGLGQFHTLVEILRVDAVPGKDPKYGGRFIDLSQKAAQMLETFINNRLR
jgi:CheY-like chemotaxis protein